MKMKISRMIAGALTVLLAASMAIAQGNPQRGNRPGEQTQPQTTQQPEPGQQRRVPLPDERSSVTRHSARIGGQQINYTATAATYNIKADDGTPKATFF